MNDGAVDDYAGRHHAAADDGGHILDFFQRHFDALFLGDRFDQGNRVATVGAACTENLDVFMMIPFAGL